MRVFSSKPALSALALIAAVAFPTEAISSEVRLRSSDGSVDMSGELVDVLDGYYVIRTDLGDLRISTASVSCEGDACPTLEIAVGDVTLQGSDTIGLGLMPLLLSGYATFLEADAEFENAGGRSSVALVGDSGFGDEIGVIQVNSTSSGDGLTALVNQDADIGMVARRITRNEARALKDSGAGNMVSPSQEHVVAVDSLVVIVHPSNPIQQISFDQLQDIYSGKVTNWAQLGGSDAPISVINRQEGSGTRSVFKSRIFGDDTVQTGSNQTIVNDGVTMAETVNRDPNAIGYVGYAFQRGAKALDVINECGLLTEPDSFSAKAEEYALQRRLYLYNRADLNNEQASDFIAYTTSEGADSLITKSGFIDLGVTRKVQDIDSQRAQTLLKSGEDDYERGVIREMVAEMVNYDRLSSTFRFRATSSKLDERARSDMQRLVDYLERQSGNMELVFVGFTDDTGTFDSNRELSLTRAEQVIAELRAMSDDRIDDVSMSALGFGSIAPVACNSSDAGRASNRRVEVWIRSAS